MASLCVNIQFEALKCGLTAFEKNYFKLERYVDLNSTELLRDLIKCLESYYRQERREESQVTTQLCREGTENWPKLNICVIW